MAAAKAGHVEVVKVLLAAKADQNALNSVSVELQDKKQVSHDLLSQ